MDFPEHLGTYVQDMSDSDTQGTMDDDLQQYLAFGPKTPVRASLQVALLCSSRLAQVYISSAPKTVQLPAQFVSTAFNPTLSLDASPVDTIFVSSDGTLFTVHRHRVLASSSNHLNGLLPDLSFRNNAIVSVPESTETLSILLHAVYGLPCAGDHPTFACLSETVDILRKYGLEHKDMLTRGQPLYEAFLFIAPLNPIETYALAASEGLEDLAAAASPYTLSTKLHLIHPALIEKMGLSYLHRLHQLHGTRMDTLKELLSVKIFPHVATSRCSAIDRQVTGRAFELAASQVYYEATPGKCDCYLRRYRR